MRQLVAALLMAAVVVSVSANAEQPPLTVAEGEYGCCCPWAEWAGWCPVDFMDFFSRVDQVCVLLDEEGNITGYCLDDPDGAYIFRGLTWPERAAFLAEYYGFEPTMGAVVDWFCGIDRMHAPGSE